MEKKCHADGSFLRTNSVMQSLIKYKRVKSTQKPYPTSAIQTLVQRLCSHWLPSVT